MIPNKRSIFDLFDGTRRYEVPLFQRQYVWSEERQWLPLWDDLLLKFKHQLIKREGPRHFLGAAVLEQKRTYGDELPTHVVIDGQQRLTTLQIFLAAFRDVCRARADAAPEDSENKNLAARVRDIERYVLHTDVTMADPNIECFKVWPTRYDQQHFREVMTCGGKQALEKIHPPRVFRKKLQPRPAIVTCYLFFYGKLHDYITATDLTGTEVDRARAAINALRGDFQIVTIELETGDDAQVIFETLNARGEPLTAADLLRNFIFLRASQNKEDQVRLHTDLWARFDQPFWREVERQGRLYRPRVELFLHHFLTAKTLSEINSRNLFSEYKDWALKRAKFPNIETELKELVRLSDFFAQLISADSKTAVGRFAGKLSDFDTKTIYPLVLWLLSENPSEAERDGMLRDLEAYIVRRAVCGRSPKAYNRVFLVLTTDLSVLGCSRENLRILLRELKGETEDFPTDKDFEAAWMNQQAYTQQGPARVNSILRSIERELYDTRSERVEITSTLTVEHVLPGAWLEHWPLPDGQRGSDLTTRILEPGSSQVVATFRRDALLHTFGNLTLLTQPLNSEVSNGPFSDKRPAITSQSLLRLNAYFQERKKWDEDDIIARGRTLFERARRLWEYPTDLPK